MSVEHSRGGFVVPIVVLPPAIGYRLLAIGYWLLAIGYAHRRRATA